jgi:hypothetical protein
VFEYDLRGFFDNVNNFHASLMIHYNVWQKRIAKSKGRWDVHSYVFNEITALYQRQPDRKKFLDRVTRDPLIKYMVSLNESRPKWSPATHAMRTGDTVRILDEISSATDWLKEAGIMKKTNPWQRIVVDVKKRLNPYFATTDDGINPIIWGVPQGAPHSPWMAMLCKSLQERGNMREYELENHIQYVDDGITDRPVETHEKSGSKLSLRKSGWVKKDNRWIKPLKFLGLRYIGDKNLLEACTRNGATLRFEGPIVEVIKKKLNLETLDWDKIVNSKYWGWIMSRLYQNSWSSPKYLSTVWRSDDSKESLDETIRKLVRQKYKYISGRLTDTVEELWMELLEEVDQKMSKIHSRSLKAYLVGMKKWIWKDIHVTSTNMSSVACGIFINEEEWRNIPLDPRNEYRRRMIAISKVVSNLPPLITRNREVYVNGTKFKDWAEFRRYLEKGRTPIVNMISLLGGNSYKSSYRFRYSWIYKTVKKDK